MMMRLLLQRHRVAACMYQPQQHVYSTKANSASGCCPAFLPYYLCPAAICIVSCQHRRNRIMIAQTPVIFAPRESYVTSSRQQWLRALGICG